MKKLVKAIVTVLAFVSVSSVYADISIYRTVQDKHFDKRDTEYIFKNKKKVRKFKDSFRFDQENNTVGFSTSMIPRAENSNCMIEFKIESPEEFQYLGSSMSNQELESEVMRIYDELSEAQFDVRINENIVAGLVAIFDNEPLGHWTIRLNDEDVSIDQAIINIYEAFKNNNFTLESADPNKECRFKSL